MRSCPKCSKENSDDAVFCAYCAAPFSEGTAVKAPVIVMPASQPKTDVKPIAIVGVICAFISLFFFPPIFGVLAILLGAYALSKASEEQKSFCWCAIILGVVFMVLGLFMGMLAALTFF